MRYVNRLGLVLLAAAGCVGSATDGPEPDLGTIEQPSVCGPEPTWKDIRDVVGGTTIEGVIRRKARLVGLLSWGTLEGSNWTNTTWAANRPICTVTLLDPTHVLTAGHCFLSHARWPQVNGRRVTPDEAAPQMVVRFGLQAGGTYQEPNDQVAVVALEDRDIRGLDFAVLRIAQAVDEAYWMPGDVPDFNFQGNTRGDELAVIQHPAGGDKKAATGEVRNIAFDELWHDVDTDNGSSGAAVFDASGRIVGIHTRGGCDDQGNVARIAFFTVAESDDLLCLVARNDAYRRGGLSFTRYREMIRDNKAPWEGRWSSCAQVAGHLRDAHTAGAGGDGGDDAGAGDAGQSTEDEQCRALRESVRQRVNTAAFEQAERNNWAPVYWSCEPPLEQQSFSFADCHYAIEQRCGGPNR